ncbi:carotenoid 1,2-hydratase [Shewanella olleyana]|uniref:lipocalin-like domain-containing protein n=1 Tax=Shewanella olleyana TaxID=135626 RepID=UPI0020101675|nr:lipocalin-like domain-containing protein [Shewanella olleyana]MCL1065969.1 carotenoid 1,2-hydratase [Shewanella olleyana]
MDPSFKVKQAVNHLWLVLLALLTLSACQQPESSSSLSMGGLLGEPSSQMDDYDSVTSGYQFSFPDDHLSHDNFRQEWWYLTANMQTQSGEKLGIQWTQFRIALAADNAQKNTEHNTDWATSQMYMSHAAITSQNHHQAAEKWSRGHPNLADVSAEPFTVKLDDWQWVSETTGLFPAKLSVATDEFSYQLSLTSDAPMQLQGDEGFSIKSADAAVASYYYSQPFIELSGTITRNGIQESVTGKAWLDREWSSQFLTKAQQGWDWFSIRLDDDSALMVFQLRGADEKTPAFYSARRMFSAGSGRNITSAQSLDDISMTPLSWQQTDNGKYPTSWQLAIASEQIDITISALNPNSNMPLSIPYWEGPISVIGSHSGDGYMELTGY